eukprot:TRINITY_DN12624_c1_g1_i1.p1 TRINITY_DN12624_c1_g1~~TRINITY_DN12624_c1_g1_i1.p1  ORF type:complete len:285 (+),score=14.57 TRINITY_DN12624_c1_g1_i1:75-929(+)
MQHPHVTCSSFSLSLSFSPSQSFKTRDGGRVAAVQGEGAVKERSTTATTPPVHTGLCRQRSEFFGSCHKMSLSNLDYIISYSGEGPEICSSDSAFAGHVGGHAPSTNQAATSKQRVEAGNTDQAAVTCCYETAGSVDAYRHEDNCSLHKNLTYSQALQFCTVTLPTLLTQLNSPLRDHQFRLCTESELPDKATGKGCGLDYYYQWTSTECTETSYVALRDMRLKLDELKALRSEVAAMRGELESLRLQVATSSAAMGGEVTNLKRYAEAMEAWTEGAPTVNRTS